jgi:hypothetical protein
MKKIIIILIALLVIFLGFLGWQILFNNPDTPIGETIRDVLPFGSGDGLSPTTGGRGPTTNDAEQLMSDELSVPTSDLFRLVNTPVAGAVVFEKNGSTIVRYVDRATGHIYDISLPDNPSSASLEKVKVSNNTLPKIYEAHFRPDGDAVVVRALKDNSDVIENLSLTLTPPQSTSTTLYSVSSNTLRGDISSMALGAGNVLFYVLQNPSSIVSSALNGTGVKTLFASAFSDWQLVIAGNSLLAHTRASASAPGYAYTVNTTGGALTKILGPLNGLTAIPNVANNRALYSYTDSNRVRLFAKNLQNNNLSEILPATLAEKCVWSVVNINKVFCGIPTISIGRGEPDGWYRGATQFSDRLWSFDTGNDTAQVLIEPKLNSNVDIDAFKLKLSPNEDYLIFQNKRDISLWVLRLK